MNNNIIKKPKASTRRESNPFYAPLRETTSTKLQNPQNVLKIFIFEARKGTICRFTPQCEQNKKTKTKVKCVHVSI